MRSAASERGLRTWAAGADDYERDLLSAFDRGERGALGHIVDTAEEECGAKCA